MNTVNTISTTKWTHPHAVRTGLSVLSLSIALTLGLAPAISWAQETPVNISIPAQPLGEALLQLGEQTSLQIFFPQDVAAGLSTAPLSGNLEPEQALRQLLEGTGIHYVRDGNNVTLSRPAEGGPVTLAPVKVLGSALVATSEGTGSYAAQAATLFKGTQSLREIPQSVSVLTRQQMDDQGLTTVADAMRQVAGVALNNGAAAGEPEYWARGYRMSAQVDGMQSTAEVGRYTSSAPSLAMYDRIEVLRGVGGLLRGNGEPGGVINYVKKRPGYDPATSMRLQAGSWDHYYTELDVSRPLNTEGTLRGRAVLAYQDEDKFYDVAIDQTKLAYGVLEYDLTPATTLGLSASYSRRKSTLFWGLPRYSDESLPSRSSFVGDDDNPMYTEQTDLGIDLEHRFDSGWNLKAAYSQIELNRDYLVAYSTSAIDTTTGLGSVSTGNDRYDSTNKAFDLNVSGPLQLFGRTHNLTLGYDRHNYEYTHGARWSQLSDWDVLNDHDFSGLFPADGNQTQRRIKRSGFYTTGRISLADDWTVVLGGRWSDYDSKSRGVTVPTGWNVNAKADKKFTPYGGLLWDVSEQVTLYGSYAEIFEPQSQTDYTGSVLKPRIGWQTELGAKGEFFDGRLNTSVALFRIRDENRSITDPDPSHVCGSSGTGACSMAAGLWQSQGWEMEVSGSPAPGWDVSASYTRTMTKVLRAADASAEGQVANIRVPEHMFKLWTQYRPGASILDGALERWTFGAGVYASSRVGGTVASAPFQGGYATVSAKAGYRINKQWDASLLVGNLFDRRYLESVGTLNSANFYGQPRNFMLSLSGRF